MHNVVESLMLSSHVRLHMKKGKTTSIGWRLESYENVNHHMVAKYNNSSNGTIFKTTLWRYKCQYQCNNGKLQSEPREDYNG